MTTDDARMGEDHDEDFEPLPSAMQMEAQGDDRAIIREAARQDREQLGIEAQRDQAFAILWARWGTRDDDDRALAWLWFNAGRDVLAVMKAIRPKQMEAEAIADGAQEMLLFHQDVPWAQRNAPMED